MFSETFMRYISNMKPLTFIIYMTVGMISLILGIIGIFMPILPTTPFLLMASFCFVRSSTKMNDWLLNHKVFGVYLKNYLEYRAIRKKDLIRSLLSLWIALILSMFLSQKILIVILLVIVGILVSIHLLKLKVLD